MQIAEIIEGICLFNIIACDCSVLQRLLPLQMMWIIREGVDYYKTHRPSYRTINLIPILCLCIIISAEERLTDFQNGISATIIGPEGHLEECGQGPTASNIRKQCGHSIWKQYCNKIQW